MTAGAMVNPFAALFEPPRARQLKTARVDVRISGQKVTDARLIPVDDPEEKARLKKELQRAKNRAKYQQARKDPEKMAKRQAWYEQNKEKVKAWKKEYDQKNKARINERKLAWALRAYHADPDKYRQVQREYYARNREKILAKLAEQRRIEAAAKAEAKTAQSERKAAKARKASSAPAGRNYNPASVPVAGHPWRKPLLKSAAP
jgi:hypothetical protein